MFYFLFFFFTAVFRQLQWNNFANASHSCRMWYGRVIPVRVIVFCCLINPMEKVKLINVARTCEHGTTHYTTTNWRVWCYSSSSSSCSGSVSWSRKRPQLLPVGQWQHQQQQPQAKRAGQIKKWKSKINAKKKYIKQSAKKWKRYARNAAQQTNI